ncbi:hypothetical protein ACLKA6_008499 [Drosophila palustris]
MRNKFALDRKTWCGPVVASSAQGNLRINSQWSPIDSSGIRRRAPPEERLATASGRGFHSSKEWPWTWPGRGAGMEMRQFGPPPA